MLEVRPGFNPSHLTTVQIWIPISNNPANDPYSVEEKRADFLLEVSRRVSALPGVEQASISGNDTLPIEFREELLSLFHSRSCDRIGARPDC